MYSKVTIAKHPIHPALVAFPVVYYTSTVAAMIIFLANGDPFWFRAAMLANVAGVATAVVAAIPGALPPPTADMPATAAAFQPCA